MTAWSLSRNGENRLPGWYTYLCKKNQSTLSLAINSYIYIYIRASPNHHIARCVCTGLYQGYGWRLGLPAWKRCSKCMAFKIYIPKVPTGTREAQEDDQRLLREAEQAMELLESYFRGAPKLYMIDLLQARSRCFSCRFLTLCQFFTLP